MNNTDIKALLKRVVELVMPDLRSYYRVVRKAKVVKTYASDGNYWADVQPLRNDGSEDPNEPVVPKVEIPVIWAGPNRGIVCPPTVGSLCDLSYYDGDPDYPRISNFRWQGNIAPAIGENGFIIQLDPANYIKIDPAKHVITLIEGNKENTVGVDKTENIGGNWTIQVAGIATIQAPQINLLGKLSATKTGGGGEAIFDNPTFETKGGTVDLASQGSLQNIVLSPFLSRYDGHTHNETGSVTSPPNQPSQSGDKTGNTRAS